MVDVVCLGEILVDLVPAMRGDSLATFRVRPDGRVGAIASPEARVSIPSPTCVLAALPRV